MKNYRAWLKETMRKPSGVVLLLLVAAVLISPAVIMAARAINAFASASTVYVTPDGRGSGSGTDWNNAISKDAFVASMDAISKDKNLNVTFYLSKGQYDLKKSLPLPKGVKIYGGFSGDETDPGNRDITAIMSGDNALSADIATILSRDADVVSTDKFSIITGIGDSTNTATSADTVLDGVTITGGTGYYYRSSDNDGDCGGGMFNNYYFSPTIANCTFIGNMADYGGGIYNGTLCSPTVTNCVISRNTAKRYGGGMYNYIDQSNPVLDNCTFSGNRADYGGGIYSKGPNSTLTNCTFSLNIAKNNGGGVGNDSSGAWQFKNCAFIGNEAETGGGAYEGSNHSGGAYSEFSGCTFSNNATNSNAFGGSGGGVYVSYSGSTFKDCTFNNNKASNSGDPSGIIVGGGGMYINNSTYSGTVSTSTDITNCTFSNNTASYSGHSTEDSRSGGNGGGMYAAATDNLTVTSCDFSSNKASCTATNGSNAPRGAGGGVYCDGSAQFTDCTFSNNTADGNDGMVGGGGGMYNNGSSTVINCTFSKNISTTTASSNYAHGGGGIHSSGSPTVTGCTFSDNEATRGGGMLNRLSNTPKIDSCTFSGNKASYSGGGMYNSKSCPTVTNCTFYDNEITATEGIALFGGGGMCNYNHTSESMPIVTNCTFNNNKAIHGNGMSTSNSRTVVANTIFDDSPATSEFYNDPSATDKTIKPIFQNCVIPDATDDSSGYFYYPIIKAAAMKFINTSPTANGGLVGTMAISANSPAFRKGLKPGIRTIASNSITITIPATDARGVSFDETNADIGAYAWQYGSGSVTVSAANARLEIGQSTTVTVNSDVKAKFTASPDIYALERIKLSASPSGRVSISDDRVTAIDRGSTVISADQGQYFPVAGVKITVFPKSTPIAEVTGDTRTDTAATGAASADASGVIVIEKNTAEDFAIYDGLDSLFDNSLPDGITPTSAEAISAKSGDLEVTARDIFTDEAIKEAIGKYWNLGASSTDKVRMISVQSATGVESVFAKIWRLLSSFFSDSNNYNENKYLPLQTNFVITSADIAALPESIKIGLSAGSLLSKLDIFVLVKSGDEEAPVARSLNDIELDGVKLDPRWITVTAKDGGYLVKTRLLVFDQIGGVKKAPGAKWVQKLKARDWGDEIPQRTEGNYFLVQDGKADHEYAVAMAFAAKETNYATIHVTVETTSGDIPVSTDWSISSDNGYIQAGITSADWTNETVSGDAAYTLGFPQYVGYKLTVTPSEKQQIAWGASLDIKATYSQIHAESVSLDKSEAVLSYTDTTSFDVTQLKAAVTPDNALEQSVTWSSSAENVAAVDANGNVTPHSKGKAIITATTSDGSKTATCEITVLQRIEAAAITVTSSEVYVGSEIKPDVTLTVNGSQLVASDYTVAYGNNTNVGTATITVTGSETAFTAGAKTASFEIKPKDASTFAIAAISDQPYTGEAITPALTIKDGEKTLSATTDYSVAYSNNTNAGTATVDGTVKGNYTGTTTATFGITPKDVSTLTIAAISDQPYTGDAITPTLIINDGDKTLSAATDYSVAYSNNTNAGTAAANVTFKGNYTGTTTATFGITPKDVSTLTIAAISDQPYTGEAITPALTIKDGEKTLTVTTDYTVAYSDNTNAGTATAGITFKGNYTGTTTATFGIKPKDASTFAIAAISDQPYTGKAITPALTIKDGEKTLSATKDYSVAYSNNTNAGTATVDITFKGNYSGTANTTFIIIPRKVTLKIAAIPDQTYTGNAIIPTPAVMDDLGTVLALNTDYTLSYKDNVRGGALAKMTATGIGNYKDSAGNAIFAITPKPGDPEVTDATRTDRDNSGVITVGEGTKEDFAIYDAMKAMSEAGTLASGIKYDAKALAADSADITTGIDLYSETQLKAAIGEYWNISQDTESKVQLVKVADTMATNGQSIFEKIWTMLVSAFKGNHGEEAFGEGDYLPLATNFTITSADLAALPADVKEGLTASNLLDKINLFAIVTSGDSVNARSMCDAAGTGKTSHISVSGDMITGFTIQSRVMLFNMEGTISGDKTTGAAWVQPLSADKTSDNWFIVQDGSKDEKYQLCLAFAAKAANYATAEVTVSGDIDQTKVYWSISGDTAIINGNASADIKGGEQSITVQPVTGYSITMSDTTQQNLSPDVTVITADLIWGGTWNVTATFAKIKAETLSLDITSAVMAEGGTKKLIAAVVPANAFDKTVFWSSSNETIATVAADGMVTAVKAGKTTIAATVKDGGGAKATCEITVRKATISEDPATGGTTTTQPETEVPPLPEGTPGTVIPVEPEYTTNPAEQEKIIASTDFTEDNAAVDKNGNLTPSAEVVISAVTNVLSQDTSISKDSVTTFPITITSADQIGMIHASGFKVSGDLFGAVKTVGEIKVMKIFPDGTGKLFKVATTAVDITDMSVMLTEEDGTPVTGAIEPSKTYILIAYILDGGAFDLSHDANGIVIDPIAIIKVNATEPPTPIPPTHNTGSGGGCSTGAGMAAMLLAAIPMLIRKKNQQ